MPANPMIPGSSGSLPGSSWANRLQSQHQHHMFGRFEDDGEGMGLGNRMAHLSNGSTDSTLPPNGSRLDHWSPSPPPPHIEADDAMVMAGTRIAGHVGPAERSDDMAMPLGFGLNPNVREFTPTTASSRVSSRMRADSFDSSRDPEFHGGNAGGAAGGGSPVGDAPAVSPPAFLQNREWGTPPSSVALSPRHSPLAPSSSIPAGLLGASLSAGPHVAQDTHSLSSMPPPPPPGLVQTPSGAPTSLVLELATPNTGLKPTNMSLGANSWMNAQVTVSGGHEVMESLDESLTKVVVVEGSMDRPVHTTFRLRESLLRSPFKAPGAIEHKVCVVVS